MPETNYLSFGGNSCVASHSQPSRPEFHEDSRRPRPFSAVALAARVLRVWWGALLVAALALPVGAMPGDGHWDRQFAMPGTATRNYSLRFNGNLLYTSGYSVNAGIIDTNSVINVFDGTNWSILAQVNGGQSIVYDYAFVGSNMYVGGMFNAILGVPAVGLARWDGHAWSDVGGFKGVALSLATDGTNLYVGGSFTNAGGLPITNFAKWNGTTWSAVGGSIGYYDSLNSGVHAVALRNGQLYVGGMFANAGTTPATNLARWDGSAWSQVGGGVGGAAGDSVEAIEFFGTDLYVSGSFETAGGISASNVAKWNGSAWSALGAGIKGPPGSTSVDGLAFLGSDLYVTGSFTNVGGAKAPYFAKWDGSAWSCPGALNAGGHRLLSSSGSIYLCGGFNLASNVIGNHIIRFDGSAWHGLAGKGAQGTHYWVQTLEAGADGLYMGGWFSAAGDIPAAGIARWDKTNWHALGSGISGSYAGNLVAVRALKTRNNQVFVGGGFVTAGGVTVNNIALWDGSNWWPLGYGVDDNVIAIDADDTKVYVGGSFLNASDDPFNTYAVNRIASWDPVNGWYPLGLGVGGSVCAICVANGRVYAGGSFTTAGGNPANRIAAWDGANWTSLGTGAANGLGGTVYALLADGADLYVGGYFTTAGGATARGIAKWNGSAWSTLGEGFSASGMVTVYALAKAGGYLYAGGIFTNTGGLVTRAVARWDGSQWLNLGSGVGNDQMYPRVYALETWGNDLFVGGIFETAGLVDSGYIARWNDQVDFTPPSTMQLLNPRMAAGNVFKFRATATPGTTYVVDYSGDLRTWTPLRTNQLPWFDVTNSIPGAQMRVYRMRQVP